MKTARFLSLAGASAIALLAGIAVPNQAQACRLSQNDIFVDLYDGRFKTYCKAINSDIEVRRVAASSSILVITVHTAGETGSCDLYAITKNGERHKKFNIGDYESQTTRRFQRGVYAGFRLGC